MTTFLIQSVIPVRTSFATHHRSRRAHALPPLPVHPSTCVLGHWRTLPVHRPLSRGSQIIAAAHQLCSNTVIIAELRCITFAGNRACSLSQPTAGPSQPGHRRFLLLAYRAEYMFPKNFGKTIRLSSGIPSSAFFFNDHIFSKFDKYVWRICVICKLALCCHRYWACLKQKAFQH